MHLSQAAFDKAETIEAIQVAHATFIEDFNTTEHAAHQHQRQTSVRRSQYLHWVHGRIIEPERLRTVLRQVQFERAVNQQGYISIQRYYIYAERGLARQHVSV